MIRKSAFPTHPTDIATKDCFVLTANQLMDILPIIIIDRPVFAVFHPHALIAKQNGHPAVRLPKSIGHILFRSMTVQ
ncbi:hypothetical protein D3C80_2095020 [compost metagenome]